MRDLLSEVLESIRRNKLRTALAGLSVSWGIFMLIVLIGAGNGVTNAFDKQGGDFLSNTMEIGGGWTTKSYDGLGSGRRIKLQERDVALTGAKDFSDIIDDVTATVSKSDLTLSVGKNSVQPRLVGVYPAHAQMNKVDMVAGRFINEKDISELRKVVVLSSDDIYTLFDTHDPEAALGRNVKIGNLSFKVAGVFEADRMGWGSEEYLPFTTLKQAWGLGDEIGNITFTFHGLEDEQANEDFEDRYRAAINALHRAAPDDKGSVWIWNRFTQDLQMNKADRLLEIALWVIGLFTLVSGIVGISNIMLITVKERTHEFGIRKALGATPWKIVKLIIAEAVGITATFGYIGMFLGMLGCEWLGHNVESTSVMGENIAIMLNPGIGLDTALEATLLLVIAGTLAGLSPALKAAKVKPIEALNSR